MAVEMEMTDQLTVFDNPAHSNDSEEWFYMELVYRTKQGDQYTHYCENYTSHC